MADVANITFTGNMGRSAETTETPTSSVAKFSVACNGWSKDKDTEPSWFECEAWGKTGEIIQKYGGKGKQVCVSGTPRIDKWKDKDGNKKEKFVVRVQDIKLMGSKEDTPVKEAKPAEKTDDIPF